MKDSKVLFTNSILYTIGNLMLKAFSFFLIPLYTSFLSTEEYGVVNLATGFFGVAAALITLSLGSAQIRYYAEFRGDEKQIAKMIGTAFTFLFGVGAVFITVMMLLGDLAAQWFFGGLPFFPVAFLSVIISAATGLYNVYQELLKGMQEAGKSVILSYTYFFLLLGSNILTVVTLGLGANGVLISTTLVNVLMVVIMLVDLCRRKLFAFGIDRQMLKKLLTYSLPIVPHTMAYNISNYATKIIIAGNLSFSMLGIFSLASQFGNLADVILNSVQSAFQPWMFSTMKSGAPDSKQNLSKMADSLMWVYGLLFLGLAALSQEAVFIIADSAYASAWTYIPAVVISIAIKAPLYFYNSCLYYDTTKTKYILVPSVLGSLTNVLLTWALVPHLAVYGSILADILAMLVRLAVISRILPKEVKKIFSLGRMTVLSLTCVAFIVAALIPAYTVYTDSLSLVNFLYKCVVILAYLVLAVIVNRKELAEIIRSIQKRK